MSYNKEKKMKITYMDTEIAKQGTEMHYVDLKPNGKKRKTAGMPKWFKTWSETVYQNQQPAWFKTWSETDFSSLKDDVADLKVRMTNVETTLKDQKSINKKVQNYMDSHP